MAQYIDKDALVAEIKRRRDESWLGMYTKEKGIIFDITDEILSFIDTLEVKEVEEEPVSNDLEEAANSYIDNWYKLNNLDKKSYPIDVEISKNDFKAGAEWQKRQILGDDNKQYHRLRHETLKRLYENEAKLELMLDNSLEGYIEKYEQIGGHNYLSLKIPMLSKPDDCKDGDKIKLIILKEK